MKTKSSKPRTWKQVIARHDEQAIEILKTNCERLAANVGKEVIVEIASGRIVGRLRYLPWGAYQIGSDGGKSTCIVSTRRDVMHVYPEHLRKRTLIVLRH